MISLHTGRVQEAMKRVKEGKKRYETFGNFSEEEQYAIDEDQTKRENELKAALFEQRAQHE